MINFTPAVRQGVKALVLLHGPSGCGKTYSAILLARGLVGQEGRIGFIDSESGRGSHYANLTPYDRGDLSPPYSPLRYMEAVDAAEAAGYDALIIDSISHEWEGEGGVLEWAESIELRTKKSGLHCWNKPKGAHKKFINRLLRARLHIIFCARAREKPKQVNNGKGTEIISDGFQPIVEKNFPYEMLISIGMTDTAPGVPDLTLQKKIPGELLPAFPAGQHIGIKTGQTLAKWLDGAAPVDPVFAEQVEQGRVAAREGTNALRVWWGTLSKDDQAALKPMLDGELKSIARASEAFNDASDEAGLAAETDHKRPSRTRERSTVDSVIGSFVLKTETITDPSALVEAFEALQLTEEWLEATADQQARAKGAHDERGRALLGIEGEPDAVPAETTNDFPFDNEASEISA